MNLADESRHALDWPVVSAALAAHTATDAGRRLAEALAPLPTAAEVRSVHDLVDEIALLEQAGEHLPIGGISDVGDPIYRSKRGEVLEGAELLAIGHTLFALSALSSFLLQRDEAAPGLAGIAAGFDVEEDLTDELRQAFEPTGELSARTYPVLGDLRRAIADLHSRIRDTLDELVKGDTLEDVLQDRFVTQRNDRYVLPIKAHARRWDLGIVHGASGSGATVFVEPHSVVELNNRLRLTEAELAAEERRILTALSAHVGQCAEPLLHTLDLAALVDLHHARFGLSRTLKATRPRVGEEGVILLKDARHPVLALRGVDVIGNDLALTPEQPALVLTGPNAGGKTVALKTIGLCALLVRAGCFVPAAAGSRCDLFQEVLAIVGDAQSVVADLSSFSGHLTLLGAMLERASLGALTLLDELCSGTDPTQGAALAVAFLEELLVRHARVVVTTHFARLKALPASDPRFATAAMEYVGGQPTYRVLLGSSGESHAFDVAGRMGLPGVLVDRARKLVDEADRTLQQSLEALDAERRAAAATAERAERRAAQLEAQLRAVEERDRELAARAKAIEQERAAAFLARLDQAEKAIGAVVAELQRAGDPRRVAAAKATVAALRGLVPQPEEEPVGQVPIVAVGDRVRIRSLNKAGDVVAVGDGTLQVRASGLTLRVRPDEVEPLAPAPVKVATRVQRATSTKAPDLTQSVRTPANTVDLRGLRVDEATDAVDAFFDRALLEHYDVVFLLHGHGTGALKQALREWLRQNPYVLRAAPANADQGGDAFTVVALRGA